MEAEHFRERRLLFYWTQTPVLHYSLIQNIEEYYLFPHLMGLVYLDKDMRHQNHLVDFVYWWIYKFLEADILSLLH